MPPFKLVLHLIRKLQTTNDPDEIDLPHDTTVDARDAALRWMLNNELIEIRFYNSQDDEICICTGLTRSGRMLYLLAKCARRLRAKARCIAKFSVDRIDHAKEAI